MEKTPMTDKQIIHELRRRFADRFSIVGPDAFRCAIVDPDEAAEFMLAQVRDLDNR